MADIDDDQFVQTMIANLKTTLKALSLKLSTEVQQNGRTAIFADIQKYRIELQAYEDRYMEILAAQNNGMGRVAYTRFTNEV